MDKEDLIREIQDELESDGLIYCEVENKWTVSLWRLKDW